MEEAHNHTTTREGVAGKSRCQSLSETAANPSKLRVAGSSPAGRTSFLRPRLWTRTSEWQPTRERPAKTAQWAVAAETGASGCRQRSSPAGRRVVVGNVRVQLGVPDSFEALALDSNQRETSAARLIRASGPSPLRGRIGDADVVLSASRMVPAASKAPVGPAQRPRAGPADGGSSPGPRGPYRRSLHEFVALQSA